MSIVRLIVAWLVMAALPLQGLAAVSMLFCGPAAHAGIAQQDGHDHAAHGHAEASRGHDTDHHHGATDDDAKRGHHAPDASAATADDGHACPICASCCNLVALTETHDVVLGAGPPAAHPLQGPVRVLTRAAPAPDKPPRA